MRNYRSNGRIIRRNTHEYYLPDSEKVKGVLGGVSMRDPGRIKVRSWASRWALTPLGWIVVFLAALFLAGFCCGFWFGR